MTYPSWQPIDAAVVLAVLWIVLGLLALSCARTPRIITDGLFPVSALIALLIALTGVWAMADSASSAILAVGLHDRVGDDGALVVFPRHDRASRRAQAQGRFHLSPDRASRRNRDPAFVRRAARRPRRLHVRRIAPRGADAVLGDDRVPARVFWF